MRYRYLKLAALLLLAIGFTLAPHLAYAQGGVAASLSGTVVDSTGAVVPGADVVVKNNATAATQSTVSGANGLFTIPALDPGSYTVTVSLQGFKTAVLNDIRLNAGQPGNVKATLQLGELSETVVVSGATEIVQTQKTSVSATLTQKQITQLPLPGRGAFDLVTYMPGVTTADGSSRGAMVNGLPARAASR